MNECFEIMNVNMQRIKFIPRSFIPETLAIHRKGVACLKFGHSRMTLMKVVFL